MVFITLFLLLVASICPSYALDYCSRYATGTAIQCYTPSSPPPVTSPAGPSNAIQFVDPSTGNFAGTSNATLDSSGNMTLYGVFTDYNMGLFNTGTNSTNTIEAHGVGDGGSNNYAEFAWYNNNTGFKMGSLSDDGAGTYGNFYLDGNSNMSQRIAEWDVIDLNLGGDQRAFTLHVEKDPATGKYYMGWNPLDSGGSFEDGTFNVIGTGSGHADGTSTMNCDNGVWNGANSVEVCGSKGVSIGSASIGTAVATAPTSGLYVSGEILGGTSFVLSGGLSSQFLKADGSTDSTVYAPTASPTFTTKITTPAVFNSFVGVSKNCATSGTVTWYMPEQGSGYKKVIGYANACLGASASWTFPTAFAHTPAAVTTNQLASSLLTTLSTSAVVLTGTTSTGYILIEGT